MFQQLEENKLILISCIAALAGILFLVSFLRAPSPTKTVYPTSTRDSRNLFPPNTTFRLQGIPASLSAQPVSEDQVVSLLKKTWSIGDGTTLTVHSLATDPLDDSRKIATLSFEPSPQSVSLPAQRWSKTLAGEPEGPIDLTLDVEFFGLIPFHHAPDSDCTYDIIALSGLNGHAFGSFKQRGNKSAFMWLRDALPRNLTQAGVHARVFVYGYDSRLIGSDSFHEISDLGHELKNKMAQLMQKSTEPRRLILLGHSLGGILVKQALISLDKSVSSVFEAHILERLSCLMFFGTPSQGMDIETLLPMVDRQPNELFIRTLGHSTSVLRNQMDDFRRLFERRSFMAFWYYETRESPTARKSSSGEWTMTGLKRRLVDISSATNGMPHDYGRHVVRSINRSHSEMVKFCGTADEAYKQVLADLQAITHPPSSVMTYSLSNNHEEFLRSLDFARQDSRRDNVENAVENTCDWFFHSEEFVTWINATSPESQKGLLWVKGNPGVGKSTLMKKALSRTQNYVSQASTSIVSFFFNARGEELEKTTIGLYRSLLHQTLRHDMKALNYLLPEYLGKARGRRPKSVQWSEEVLKDYLSRAYNNGIAKPVIIFIDALDECTDPELFRMVEFFKNLVGQWRSANAGLRVCISSRHCPRPPTFGYPELTVEHYNKADIYTYIEAELRGFKTLQRLRDKIFKKSSGVFLWVRLVITELKTRETSEPGHQLSTLERILEAIPPKLEELFGGLLERLDPEDRPRTTFLFQLILFAEKPLCVETIAAIIPFRPGSRFKTAEEWAKSSECISGPRNKMAMIVKLSGGLLEFDKDKQPKCLFIHESARDYFLKSKGSNTLLLPHDHASLPGRCHSAIATASTNYLRAVPIEDCKLSPEESARTRGGFNISESKIYRRFPFLLYAVNKVYSHIEKAEEAGVSQETTLRNLGQMDAKTNFILSKLSEFEDFRPEYTQLSRCCCGGMIRFKAVSRLIKMEEDPRDMINKPSRGSCPLILACDGYGDGSVPLVELLLQNGAEIEARSLSGCSALLSAAGSGNLDVVKILLSYGAEIRGRDFVGQTVMHHAIVSEEVVEYLLMKGAEPDVKDDIGYTPLMDAAGSAFVESFLPLIRAGADVNYRVSNGDTAPHMALRNFLEEGYLMRWSDICEATRCCVAAGFDLDPGNKDSQGRTLWNYWEELEREVESDAERNQWEEIARLLRPQEEGQGKNECELIEL